MLSVGWSNKWQFPPFTIFCRMSLPKHTAAHSIPPHTLTRLAREWLEEDAPNFDPAGVCVASLEVEARLLCKTPHSVLAGSPFFTAVFTEVGCTVDWSYQEGAELGRHCTLSSKESYSTKILDMFLNIQGETSLVTHAQWQIRKRDTSEQMKVILILPLQC